MFTYYHLTNYELAKNAFQNEIMPIQNRENGEDDEAEKDEKFSLASLQQQIVKLDSSNYILPRVMPSTGNEDE